jgi:hypothetical protein
MYSSFPICSWLPHHETVRYKYCMCVLRFCGGGVWEAVSYKLALLLTTTFTFNSYTSFRYIYCVKRIILVLFYTFCTLLHLPTFLCPAEGLKWPIIQGKFSSFLLLEFAAIQPSQRCFSSSYSESLDCCTSPRRRQLHLYLQTVKRMFKKGIC